MGTAAKVYYSTPFGDTKDGRQKLFLLERDGRQYFPVFRSVESLKEFYERMNRAAYMIIEGDIKSVMDTTRSIELMKNAAIVVEPLSEHPVEIMPDF
ncbi:SseB family protein [Mycobacterium heidelbergense]|uniref:SseB family protein n=1 Tax=Mycobacterium heidelbergense TaxID=53376 RepID=UPI003CEA6F32